jgi:hypothetical protein
MKYSGDGTLYYAHEAGKIVINHLNWIETATRAYGWLGVARARWSLAVYGKVA